MTRNPTMNDVAREAGVALKTVSRFVNGETNIAPELAGRIAEAIATLGYRKNLAAASIRPGHASRVLGLIIGDLGNPYYSVLAGAIEKAASEEGYLLITASSQEDGARHDRLVERLLQQQVEGFIIVPPKSPGRPWSSYLPPVPPVVFLDRPGDDPGSDVVIADNAEGARQATAQLLTVGPRVAFVGDSLDIYTMRQRHEGYRAALAEAGGRFDASLVSTEAHGSEDAARIVSGLLEAGVDAVFAANNRASVGALMAFGDRGERVPLIGFDEFEAALVSSPRVSVVTQDVAAMGATAAKLLLERLRGVERERNQVVLPTSLVLRGSELL